MPRAINMMKRREEELLPDHALKLLIPHAEQVHLIYLLLLKASHQQ
ncbi:hypothetical protein KEJ34_06690 [Candidatus Bathyarchaeota archaeon]|nr:hypothetical protein [Candidatus Bathyarchaeota archaeon]